MEPLSTLFFITYQVMVAYRKQVYSRRKDIYRVNGAATLTFEQMTTLLTQVEACFNSRPLCLLDDIMQILDPLAPGHLKTTKSDT